MRALLDNFCVYHVTAPGQEEGAATFPDEYVIHVFYFMSVFITHLTNVIIVSFTATFTQQWTN